MVEYPLTMDTHGTYTWQVRTYECGPDGLMTLPAVCNYLQEAASLNAEELGFSKTDFAAAGADITWVLTRLRVRMTRFPKWGEKVSVLTFPRLGRRITAFRDFALTDAAGVPLGVATSEWMTIDMGTRRIAPIPEGVFALANTERAPVLGTDAFAAKLRFPEGGAVAEQRFRAQRSHIDLNGHVNNVHYVEWMLEPAPALSGTGVDLELHFRSETLAGDEVVAQAAPGAGGETWLRVAAPDGKEHVAGRMGRVKNEE